MRIVTRLKKQRVYLLYYAPNYFRNLRRLRLPHVLMANQTSSFEIKLVGNNTEASRINLDRRLHVTGYCSAHSEQPSWHPPCITAAQRADTIEGSNTREWWVPSYESYVSAPVPFVPIVGTASPSTAHWPRRVTDPRCNQQQCWIDYFACGEQSPEKCLCSV